MKVDCHIQRHADPYNPINSEMALAIALHSHSEQLYKFALLKELTNSDEAFNSWLETVRFSIEYYLNTQRKSL